MILCHIQCFIISTNNVVKPMLGWKGYYNKFWFRLRNLQFLSKKGKEKGIMILCHIFNLSLFQRIRKWPVLLYTTEISRIQLRCNENPMKSYFSCIIMYEKLKTINRSLKSKYENRIRKQTF